MNARKHYLDYLKTISIFAVILIHFFTTARTDFPNHTLIEQGITKIFTYLLHFCVPIFFMITGTLFLNEDKKISLKKLFTKYIKKYVVVLLIFGTIFAFEEQILKNGGVSLNTIFLSIISVFTGKSWAHLWYLYELIGIFLILPFIKILSESLDRNENYKKYFFIISFIFLFIIPMAGYEIPIKFRLFSEYIFYMFLGHSLDKIDKKKIHTKFLFWGLILSAVVLIGSAILNTLYENFILFDAIGQYNSPLICLYSTSLFLIFKENRNFDNNGKINKFTEFISNISLWIYIIHMQFINFIYKFLKFNIYGNLFLLKVLIAFMAVSLLSILASMILKKIFDKIKL